MPFGRLSTVVAAIVGALLYGFLPAPRLGSSSLLDRYPDGMFALSGYRRRRNHGRTLDRTFARTRRLYSAAMATLAVFTGVAGVHGALEIPLCRRMPLSFIGALFFVLFVSGRLFWLTWNRHVAREKKAAGAGG